MSLGYAARLTKGGYIAYIVQASLHHQPRYSQDNFSKTVASDIFRQQSLIHLMANLVVVCFRASSDYMLTK